MKHCHRPAFKVDWFYPAEKNRRLVVRTAAAKPGKGLEQFVKVAALCPDHQFVLVLGRVSNMDEYWERFLEFNRTAPCPVEVQVNLPHEETAALVRIAGIHLHTYGDEEPF